MGVSTLDLKPPFSQSLSLHSHLSLAQANHREFHHLIDCIGTDNQKNKETSLLLLFIFSISLVHHCHTACLHQQALTLYQLLTLFTAFSILILEPSFSQSLSLHSHLSSLRIIFWNSTTQCLDSNWRW